LPRARSGRPPPVCAARGAAVARGAMALGCDYGSYFRTVTALIHGDEARGLPRFGERSPPGEAGARPGGGLPEIPGGSRQREAAREPRPADWGARSSCMMPHDELSRSCSQWHHHDDLAATRSSFPQQDFDPSASRSSFRPSPEPFGRCGTAGGHRGGAGLGAADPMTPLRGTGALLPHRLGLNDLDDGPVGGSRFGALRQPGAKLGRVSSLPALPGVVQQSGGSTSPPQPWAPAGLGTTRAPWRPQDAQVASQPGASGAPPAGSVSLSPQMVGQGHKHYPSSPVGTSWQGARLAGVPQTQWQQREQDLGQQEQQQEQQRQHALHAQQLLAQQQGLSRVGQAPLQFAGGFDAACGPHASPGGLSPPQACRARGAEQPPQQALARSAQELPHSEPARPMAEPSQPALPRRKVLRAGYEQDALLQVPLVGPAACSPPRRAAGAPGGLAESLAATPADRTAGLAADGIGGALGGLAMGTTAPAPMAMLSPTSMAPATPTAPTVNAAQSHVVGVQPRQPEQLTGPGVRSPLRGVAPPRSDLQLHSTAEGRALSSQSQSCPNLGTCGSTLPALR